jgi:hypothetical protein
VRLQIVTDRGQYPATLPVPPEELLRPQPSVSLEEAASWQRALVGIHECKASVALPPAQAGAKAEAEAEAEAEARLASLPDAVLQAANIALVSPRARWAESGAATFAARARAGGRVVVQLEASGSRDAGPAPSVSLRVQSDDAMLSASLLEVLRRAVAAPAPAVASATR